MLQTYNKPSIIQLGVCIVTIKHKETQILCRLFGSNRTWPIINRDACH